MRLTWTSALGARRLPKWQRGEPHLPSPLVMDRTLCILTTTTSHSYSSNISPNIAISAFFAIVQQVWVGRSVLYVCSTTSNGSSSSSTQLQHSFFTQCSEHPLKCSDKGLHFSYHIRHVNYSHASQDQACISWIHTRHIPPKQDIPQLTLLHCAYLNLFTQLSGHFWAV